MPTNVTVEKVDIQTKASQKNLADLSKEMDKVAESSKDLNEEIEETAEGVEEVGESAKKSGQGIGTMGGPLGKAQTGVQGLTLAFKALLANPIVLLITAIVGGLTLLVKAFTSTKEGGEKVKQVTAGIGAGF